MIVSGIQANEIKLDPAGISARDIRKMTADDKFLDVLNQRGISPDGLRELVLVVKGIGDKQASHFLATVGFDCYAILDVHVNRKLVKYRAISEVPKNLTRAKYREIESKMKDFAKTVEIPFHHLDTLFWELGSGHND
jgi:N-glycosylase/DNA lyase